MLNYTHPAIGDEFGDRPILRPLSDIQDEEIKELWGQDCTLVQCRKNVV